MASISPRGTAWRAMIRRRGQTLTKTFDTEQQAKDWATAEEARIVRGATAVQVRKTPSGMKVADLFDRYGKEVSPDKGGARWEIIRLAALRPAFQMAVTDLDGAAMAQWRDDRMQSVSAATVNRELNLISAVLTRAIREWKLPMAANPVHSIQRPPQPRSRRRMVPAEDRAAIIKELGWDGEGEPEDIREWIAWGFCLALETMMRQGEILNLTWGNVHLDRKFCYLPKTKNGDDRKVPLSSVARSLFGLLKEGAPGTRVVPVTAGTFGAYFREACRNACVEDLHFHDTRREALTNTSKKLSNVAELARASGHKGTRALLVYYHPDITDIASKLD
jgi:integrase